MFYAIVYFPEKQKYIIWRTETPNELTDNPYCEAVLKDEENAWVMAEVLTYGEKMKHIKSR